ncbi:surface protease GP63, putative [Trypanosoma cruzi]|uniref:Leishmanolysin-like peptidase n=1 Tax=Trypanosoma cruzi (strain CL Brener) TaxID=353153 RepID=Q4DE95_TRYCC|nr:surface protease GP63, putative [Trypanosoma cruzi]EAN90849.1 surface protease GP63, putative [Trypanosoma cruzi]|eukprot:XP_812700.1 surface protease GP63 [Trypanosoma cruzi strain CL Brener]
MHCGFTTSFGGTDGCPSASRRQQRSRVRAGGTAASSVVAQGMHWTARLSAGMALRRLRTATSLPRRLSLLLSNCMRIVCSSSHWRVRWLCRHLPRAVFAVGSRCPLGIVPLVLPILAQCCPWLRHWVVCGHCRAPRWRMAVQLLAPCTLPGSFISPTPRHPHRRALYDPCARARLPAHGQPQHGEECCLCVRGGALSVVVHSTNAAMAAREHHDCNDVDGMELQDDDGDGRTLESHWWQRQARDEWMAPIGGVGDCTELALAASADLGCMRVRWNMAEPMRWSRKLCCCRGIDLH